MLSKAILGSLILSPSLLEVIDLSPADFPDDREIETFSAICEMWENRRPDEIDAVLLAEKLSGDGAAYFVSSLLTGAIRLSPEIFCDRVSELRKKRITARLLDKIERQAKKGDLNLDEILPDVDRYRALCAPKLEVAGCLKTGTTLLALDLHVEWAFDKLIPERSITILHGPGGIGKTWLGMMIAKAVSDGQELFGIETKKKSVIYLDFENPLPVLVERIQRMDLSNVMFWHLGFETPPPRFDSDKWQLFKELPKESLLIVDSLRSSQGGDENSSRDMALIMGHLKELREQGRTILLYHHASKVDERTFRGSMAITDLADHVLSLYKVNKRFEEIDDTEPDPSALYRFGTGTKTRYERFGIFLTFNGQGFELAQDPDQDALQAILEFMRSTDHPVNQSEIYEWAKPELEITKKEKITRLLRKGERINLWSSWLDKAHKNRRLYVPGVR